MAKSWKIAILVLVVSGLSCLGAGLWIPAKALLAQYLLQKAWQQSLVTGNIVKAWPWADTWPVGRLINDRLGVDLIILEGESGEVLAFGPGHLRQSTTPGEKGHCMLAGHRDTSFAFLKNLKVGDLLVLEGKDGKDAFIVQNTGVFRSEELYLDGGREETLTLITCFPFEAVMPGTPFRFVVTAAKSSGDNVNMRG